MDKQVIGIVQVSFEGKPVRVEVFEDGSVVLPDGSVKRVSTKVFTALKMRNMQEMLGHKGESEKADEIVYEGGKEEDGGDISFDTSLQEPNISVKGQDVEYADEMKNKASRKRKLKVVLSVILLTLIGGIIAGYIYWPQLRSTELAQYIVEYRVASEAQLKTIENETVKNEMNICSSDEKAGCTDVLAEEDVYIEFFAEMTTENGEKYRVPLSSVEIDNGEINGIYDGQGIMLVR